MGNQGQALGFSLLMVGFVIALVLFSTIEPFKETLDITRNQTALNCPGTPGFDQTDFNNDTDFEHLVRTPTCFVTGVSMVWFIGAVLLATISWLVLNFRKVK